MLVSVIMPAYNAGKYIAESIDSVIAQTYNNWELIVVDDGSTDNTKAVVNEYVKKDSRVHYIYQENGRQGKARNNALRNSKGELIAFLDSDDLWLPDKLAQQIDMLQTDQADLVFGSAYIFKSQPLNDQLRIMAVVNQKYQGDKAVEIFLTANRVSTLTVLMKREALEKVNGFTEELNIQNAEDYHLWIKLLMNGFTLSGSDKIVSAYRVHENSSTAMDEESNKQSLYAIHDLTKDHYKWKNKISLYNKKRIYHVMGRIKHESPSVFRKQVKSFLAIGGYTAISRIIPFLPFKNTLVLAIVFKLMTYYNSVDAKR